MTLRVAVNLLWCVPGQVGGSEEYLARQLLGLDRIDPGRERVAPTVFALPSYPGAHPEIVERMPVITARTGGSRRPARVFAEHTWLARRTRAGDLGRSGSDPSGFDPAGFDLVHHGGGTTPVVGHRPVLLTIHDLQYLEHPHYHSSAKLRYLRSVVPRSVRRAAVVAVPSEFVRGTVIDAFGTPPDGVMVVPHGFERPLHAPEVDVVSVRARLGLGPGPVLVYPAITHPHKNHLLLLETMRRHWTDPDLRLVFLGGRGAADAEVERRIVELGLEHRVVRPGRVPDADRDALLMMADALVFPSIYEGFGAPVIEAMALGTPVICGDHPALREVVADAAVVVPNDVDAWGAALATARRTRLELIAAGLERVSRFDLAASATALVAAYERTAAA
jgi:glycosyltransferase involved in cell wall biosynthesis